FVPIACSRNKRFRQQSRTANCRHGTFYPMYSTGKVKLVHLDDVVVPRKYRRYGIGAFLMNTVIDYARNPKCRPSTLASTWIEPPPYDSTKNASTPRTRVDNLQNGQRTIVCPKNN
ncbi:MAG: GNAT family N-acetyltransferase, partial [Sphingobacteriales bacterium]|nr:GNAT family N-acetyltransferase [Sphingobacteriales bacterium]